MAAWFPTALAGSPEDIFAEYRARWAGAMAMRDAHAGAGRGQEQCRTRHHIRGAHTVRLVRAAARTLWGIDRGEHGTEVKRCRYRPWDSQKVAPSQLDAGWACRAALHAAGIFPI
jgi:hypothetical protein